MTFAAVRLSLLLLPGLAFCGEDPDQHRYLCEETKTPFFVRKGSAFEANRRFSIAASFVLPRPEDAVRVFVLGESAAARLGRPVDTVVRALGPLWPGRRIEHVNCGMPAYESSRILSVFREVLQYQPSAIVLLSGNNEGMEELCPSEGPIGAFFRRVLGGLGRRLPRDLGEHERDLAAMASLAREAKVPFVLCTLPVNLRDYAPWGRATLSDASFAEGWLALERGDAALAVERFRNVVGRAPENAFAEFYLARALEASGSWEEAREHYESAVELDPKGDRCSRRRNAMMRRVADREGAILADLSAAFEEAAPHGLVGVPMLVDGVHWDDGYSALAAYAVARALFDRDGADRQAIARGYEAAKRPRFSAADKRRQAEATLLYAVRQIDLWSQGGKEGDVLELGVSLLSAVDGVDRPFLLEVSEDERGFKSLPVENFWTRGMDSEFRRYWPSYLEHLGEMYRRRGDPARALGLLNKAAESAPERFMTRFYRGLALAALGRREEARSDFRSLAPHAKERPEIAVFAEFLRLE
ncbi:MAG: tetratricopeptide repeat protein [Elusimicrobiota bacterium]